MFRLRSNAGRAIVLLLIAGIASQVAAPMGACAGEVVTSAPKCGGQGICCCGTADSEASCCCGNGHNRSDVPAPPATDHSQLLKWAISSTLTHVGTSQHALGDVVAVTDQGVRLFYGRPLQPVLCNWRI